MEKSNGSSSGAFKEEFAQARANANAGQSQIHQISDLINFWDQPHVELNYIDEGRLLIEGTMVLLTGQAGHGKTSFATALVRDASEAGRPVLILDRENPLVAVQERFERLHVTPRENFEVWGLWQAALAADPASPIVLDWVRKCDPKPIIVVDSLIAFLSGKNENQSAEVRSIMDPWRQLTSLNATVLIIHHIGKAQTAEKFRGASGILDTVDSAYLVTNQPPGNSDTGLGRLTIEPFKSRIGLAEKQAYNYVNGNFDVELTGELVHQEKIATVVAEALAFGTRKMAQLAAAAQKANISRDALRDYIQSQVKAGTIQQSGKGPATRYSLCEDKFDF